MLYYELCYRQTYGESNDLHFEYAVYARSFEFEHIMEIVNKYKLNIIDENNRLNWEDGFVITKKPIVEFEDLDGIKTLVDALEEEKAKRESRMKELDDICSKLLDELFCENGIFRKNR